MKSELGSYEGRSDHRLWIFDMHDTHVFDLLRGKKPELNLLDRAQGRAGVLEIKIRHADGEIK